MEWILKYESTKDWKLEHYQPVFEVDGLLNAQPAHRIPVDAQSSCSGFQKNSCIPK
jgi:hypothetical protein